MFAPEEEEEEDDDGAITLPLYPSSPFMLSRVSLDKVSCFISHTPVRSGAVCFIQSGAAAIDIAGMSSVKLHTNLCYVFIVKNPYQYFPE